MDTKMRETSLQEIEALLQTRKDEGNPVVLFLGTRAGMLCHNQAFYNHLREFSLRPSTFDKLSDREKLEECYKIMKHFNERDIHKIFQEVLAEIESREEDYALVKLLQQGFFDSVLSTNIDNALDALLENEEYTITDIAKFPSGSFVKNGKIHLEASSRQFYKVFGDFDAWSYTSVGSELDLSNKLDLKKFLTSLLARDVMVIGYDPIWDYAIEEVFPGEGGKIWYVDEEGPPMHSTMSQIINMRQGKCLLGKQGNYKVFINALHRYLIGGNIQKNQFGNILSPAHKSVDHDNREEIYKSLYQNGDINSARKSFGIRDGEERKRTKVFISYSHNEKDVEYLERLLVHLKTTNLPISNPRDVSEIWYDGLIEPGALWQDEIEKALEATKVAVLLVSADFFSSEFITKVELPSLLKAYQNDGVVILPVILSPCRFEKTVLKEFQSVNPPSESLAGMTRDRQEEVWSNVVTRVEEKMLPPLF